MTDLGAEAAITPNFIRIEAREGGCFLLWITIANFCAVRKRLNKMAVAARTTSCARNASELRGEHWDNVMTDVERAGKQRQAFFTTVEEKFSRYRLQLPDVEGAVSSYATLQRLNRDQVASLIKLIGWKKREQMSSIPG